MEEIEKFLSVNSGYGDGSEFSDGSGSGYGNGPGSGYGNGSGYSDGYGPDYGSGSDYGSGYGSGSGYGYGCGNDFGSGYGCGSGCSYGYDDSTGYGSGYGDGDIKSFNGSKVYNIDGVSTLIECVRGNYAKGFILNADLTLIPTYIARVGDCFAHGETLHKALEDAAEKGLQQRPLEDRINDFVKAHPKGEKFPASDYSKWHYILTGSCEQGRKSFMCDRDIKEDALYTPEEFISITSEAYGSDIIKELRKNYELHFD